MADEYAGHGEQYELRYGPGGWVMVRTSSAPSRDVYIRFSALPSGHWVAREFYMDTSRDVDDYVTEDSLSGFPLEVVEALVNHQLVSDEPVWMMKSAAETFAVDSFVHLDVIASHFNLSLGTAARPATNWLHMAMLTATDDSLRSHYDLPPLDKPRRASQPLGAFSTDDFRMSRIRAKRIDPSSETFLRAVARAHRAAVSRNEWPNKSIAEQTGKSPRTVEGWVKMARDAGYMKPARKGSVS